VIPKTATEQEIKVCHLHIDPKFAEEDLNCILPLGRLNELEEAKKIGRSAGSHYSFMGYILKPDVLLSKNTPAIIRGLQADEVDAVVLLPVWPFCCRSVGLVQREIEAAGIPTISLSPIVAFTALVGAPRIAAIEHPPGRLLGKPGDAAWQMAVLEATFVALMTIDEPGGVVQLPFEWPETPRQARSYPQEPPPISKYLKKHPWMLRKFMVKEIPD
jgi:D-proline reductase (dithiol) PrdB